MKVLPPIHISAETAVVHIDKETGKPRFRMWVESSRGQYYTCVQIFHPEIDDWGSALESNYKGDAIVLVEIGDKDYLTFDVAMSYFISTQLKEFGEKYNGGIYSSKPIEKLVAKKRKREIELGFDAPTYSSLSSILTKI